MRLSPLLVPRSGKGQSGGESDTWAHLPTRSLVVGVFFDKEANRMPTDVGVGLTRSASGGEQELDARPITLKAAMPAAMILGTAKKVGRTTQIHRGARASLTSEEE